MKYAAFSLVKEPSKTRVGIVSADEKSIQELDLGVDVSEEGIVAILDRKSTRLNSSHIPLSRMPSSA